MTTTEEQIDMTQTCTRCKGAGCIWKIKPGVRERIPCDVCEGKGRIPFTKTTAYAGEWSFDTIGSAIFKHTYTETLCSPRLMRG